MANKQYVVPNQSTPGSGAGAVSTANDFPLCPTCNPFQSSSGAGVLNNAGSQRLRYMKFRVLANWTIRQCTLQVTTAVASATANLMIYSDDGSTKLWDSGAIDCSATGEQILSFTAFTLAPGIYRLAWSCTSTTVQWNTISAGGSPVTTQINSVGDVMGTSANSTSNGVGPSSLGSTTPGSTTAPLVMFWP